MSIGVWLEIPRNGVARSFMHLGFLLPALFAAIAQLPDGMEFILQMRADLLVRTNENAELGVG